MQQVSHTRQTSGPQLSARRRLAALLGRVADGDRDAFALVYDASHRKLRSTIAEVLGRSAEVEDALQDTFLRVWRNAAQFNARVSSPMTWMMVIARNTAIDKVRRRRDLVPMGEEVLALAEPPADPFENQDQEIALNRVVSAMGCLSPERADLIMRAYVGGQSRAALAGLYGAPVSTIKTWIRRSLADLRHQLENEAVAVPPARLLSTTPALAQI